MHRHCGSLPARGLVFDGPFHAAVQGIAGKPLAFSIQYIANGLTAGGAAVACRITGRCHRGFIAARPITDWKGKKIFCRVTTRRRKIRILNGLGRDLGSSAASFSAWAWRDLSRGILAMRGLAPRRLPTTDFPLTVRVVTVTLVPTRRQILTITPLAQASPRPRSTRSRRAPASYFNVRGAHGSCNSQGKSPRRMRSHSPRAI